MPEPDRTVQCPICDADFDPAVAGGWCTNPDCGEWQYDGDIEEGDAGGEGTTADVELLEDTASPERLPSTPGPASNGHHAEEADTPVEAVPAEAVDDQRRDTPAVAADATADGAVDAHASADHDGDDATPSPDHEADSKAPAAAEHDVPTDGDSVPNDAEPADERPDDAEPTEEQTGDAEPAGERTGDAEPTDEQTDDGEPVNEPDTIDCPDCGRELDADANFCLDCGADVQEISAGGPEPLDACPECGTAVDDDASFCINCGENLDAHRNGASETGSGDDSAADGSPTGGAVEALSSQSSDEPTVPDGLVLSVAGRDIDVSDGDRVGREIRAALIDAGQPEDEAVRIHREHVRFDREEDGYYLVDLGDNPTRLNGTPLQKGDRERVEPGDELELSGVVTIAIRAR
ncbi:double zinc ribbon domain-containing protein [Haloarcula salina]|uniref:Zinc-ribbon domain-containing protein n=1 Tax=Haloarcula salina TaxID=1429914 RepID=A0AA41G309_9EURY|nr:zinc ribbon domain-containing protein [Haloarcula salina]MBV0903410.1 zinc-ribbon domain-containing protein [Haloarcula salina]